MDIYEKLESLLLNARKALAALSSRDRTVQGLVDRVSELSYAEGSLVGFLDALLIADPLAAQVVAPRIEEFVSEAIAARILLE